MQRHGRHISVQEMMEGGRKGQPERSLVGGGVRWIPAGPPGDCVDLCRSTHGEFLKGSFHTVLLSFPPFTTLFTEGRGLLEFND